MLEDMSCDGSRPIASWNWPWRSRPAWRQRGQVGESGGFWMEQGRHLVTMWETGQRAYSRREQKTAAAAGISVGQWPVNAFQWPNCLTCQPQKLLMNAPGRHLFCFLSRMPRRGRQSWIPPETEHLVSYFILDFVVFFSFVAATILER